MFLNRKIVFFHNMEYNYAQYAVYVFFNGLWLKEGIMLKNSNIPVNKQPIGVVGIGASAGGLEALQQFLTFLPSNTGMAYVIIQHLAPNHKSLLADILGKYSAMPVTEIRNGMQIHKNHIYMIPPKFNVEIQSNVLKLRVHDPQKINHPIDVFFRSLAESCENRSVAVILSGTGSDGTNGIRSIKEQNGLIIVQTPESAKFDGMPRNAIATGFVDLVQKPDAIAKEMTCSSCPMMICCLRFFPYCGMLPASTTPITSRLRSCGGSNVVWWSRTTAICRNMLLI